MIVKRDGSTILSKVLEVNPDNIKYKKASNANGPTYTILIKDILSINYENGEREIFDSAPKTSNQLFEDDSYINDGYITQINDKEVTLKLEKSNKKPKWLLRLLKVHPHSKMANKDCRIELSTQWAYDGSSELSVSFVNTSDELIYIDLGNTTFRANTKASTYFVNSSTTTSKGGEGGANVNLGSIASVLGVGGVAGTLASGVNVGGSKFSGSSTTVYAERIVTLAPHSKYDLPAKVMYSSDSEWPYKTDFNIGDRLKYIAPDVLGKAPWEIIVTYAKESDIENTKKMDVGLYISEEIPLKSRGINFIDETGFIPLFYYYSLKE